MVRPVAVAMLGAGLAILVGAVAVGASARQEVAGIGLAVIMTGMMVLVLGNYLRHAAGRRVAEPGPAQSGSVPTTETNDTISPG